MIKQYFIFISLLLFSLGLIGQEWEMPDQLDVKKVEIVVPKNIPWGQVALSIGSSLTAVALEMTGDALYDMGKMDGDYSQMKLGHTLQATGHFIPFATLPILYFHRPEDDSRRTWYYDALFGTATYLGVRFASADLFYNWKRGLPWDYSGTTSVHDAELMSRIDPAGKAYLKGFSFTVVFVLNISYLR